MLSDLSLVFALSLLASLHCAQMCGPIVLSFSLAGAADRPLPATFAYNAGRILTYTSLGALAGLLGHSFAPMGRLLGIEDTAAIIGGALMLIAGLIMMWHPAGYPLRFRSMRQPSGAGLPACATRRRRGLPLRTALIQIAPIRQAGRLLRRPGLRAKFATGALMGFLPCGLIYAALFKSLGSGSALTGAANMLAFGLGTAAPLLALGAFSATLLRWFGKYSAPIAACGVTLMGIALLWRGLRPICVAHFAL